MDKKTYAILAVVSVLGIGIGFAGNSFISEGGATKFVQTVERSFSK